METQTTAATERAAALRKQLAALGTQKQTTESKLAEEHAAIRRAALKRGGLIESLVNANEADSRRTHKEISELDAAILVGERMAESLQKALAKTVQEEATVSAEMQEADRAVQAEERAKWFEAFRINFQQAVRRVGESLDNARADLGALAVMEEKARRSIIGNDAAELELNKICEPIFTDFADRQRNLDNRGWHPFPGTRNLQFLIRSMVRR